jgi:two-component system, chemotaxis family, chemotaxis protein CheY
MSNGKNITAVVVDDSKTIRTVLKKALIAAGIEVVAEGATGTEGLELYEKHRPTLMMLDIVLPGRDGVAVAKDILERHREALVVMCSSLTAREKILACRDAGVRHFILKPFVAEKVTSLAHALVHGEPVPQAAGVPA